MSRGAEIMAQTDNRPGFGDSIEDRAKGIRWRLAVLAAVFASDSNTEEFDDSLRDGLLYLVRDALDHAIFLNNEMPHAVLACRPNQTNTIATLCDLETRCRQQRVGLENIAKRSQERKEALSQGLGGTPGVLPKRPTRKPRR